MADLTPFQLRVIRRYYENRDGLALHRLGELVSEIYLATSDKKRAQLWKRAARELEVLGRYRDWVTGVLESRDPARLARMVTELTRGTGP